jgi:uncharacterized membrane protein
MVVLVVVFVLAGALMCVLAVPLMRRRIKPNGLYGLRVPATFADEWVWYEANARSGRELFALGFCEIILALVPMIDPTFPLQMYVAGNAAFVAFGAVFFAIVGCVRANRLLKERRANLAGGTGKFGPS